MRLFRTLLQPFGKIIFYMDTDSAIKKCTLNKLDENPSCERFLREMKNVLNSENDVIVKFCACDPKNYG